MVRNKHLFQILLGLFSVIIGSYYVKDSTKRSKARYNHRTGFRRKMQQYGTSTHDHVAIQFLQSTKNGVEVHSYGTTPELAAKGDSIMTNVENNTTPLNTQENSMPVILNKEAAASTSITPTKRKKPLETTGESNICKMCNISYGTKLDNDYNSVWINCSLKNCHYWVHLKCIGIELESDIEDKFLRKMKFSCPLHQSNPPKPKYFLKKQ